MLFWNEQLIDLKISYGTRQYFMEYFHAALVDKFTDKNYVAILWDKWGEPLKDPAISQSFPRLEETLKIQRQLFWRLSIRTNFLSWTDFLARTQLLGGI